MGGHEGRGLTRRMERRVCGGEATGGCGDGRTTQSCEWRRAHVPEMEMVSSLPTSIHGRRPAGKSSFLISMSIFSPPLTCRYTALREQGVSYKERAWRNDSLSGSGVPRASRDSEGREGSNVR